MGWMETCAVDERMRFVMAVEQREEAFALVCRRFGVSRKTGYKWLARYREAGVEGLRDRSRAPLHHPQAGERPWLTSWNGSDGRYPPRSPIQPTRSTPSCRTTKGSARPGRPAA